MKTTIAAAGFIASVLMATAVVPARSEDSLDELRDRHLTVPVQGISRKELRDTFKDARGSARVHEALDVLAPRNTPVLAVEDGKVARLFLSVPGGITIYQFDPSETYVYYYAHLQSYADGLTEGKLVRQGETIAYVGDTGNAGVGNYHLHFSIASVTDPERYWEGTNINPYPLLRR